MSISFVSGEPYESSYGIAGRGQYTPIFMEKDGAKVFVRNIVKPEQHDGWAKLDYERSVEEAENVKNHLIETEGKWCCFHGRNKYPFKFIEWVQEHNYTFEVCGELFVKGEDFTDFHGNLAEYSAAFMYRIYDAEVLSELMAIVDKIPKNHR